MRERSTDADDSDLLAFEVARREAEAAGVSQHTPVNPPGLVELLRHAGAMEAGSARPQVN